MNDYDVGTRLRRQLLADLEGGRGSEPRRLQALVGDFCGDSQASLLPALKYLVLTPQFNQALQRTPPLPLDPQLLLQFRQQLAEVFAPTICSRMEAVLRGLLALPATAAAPPPLQTAVPALAPPPQQRLEPLRPEPPAGGSGRGVLALLSFIAGVLVVGLLGGLVWLLQLTRQQRNLPQEALVAAPTGVTAPQAPPTSPAVAPPAPDLEAADRHRAIEAVQQLYADLARGNSQAASQRYSPAAADQFDPAFLGQFARVSVSDLGESGRSGNLVTLTGVVTYTHPDGTSQSESRRFSVDVAHEPALITASSFEAVVSPRQ